MSRYDGAMRVCPLFVAVAAGCADEAPDRRREPAVPDTTSFSLPVGPDCDPAVKVPLGPGVVDPSAVPDPHADVLGAAPTPYQVRIGWPSSDPSTSVSILWRTDVDTLASLVEYGVGDELTERVPAASFRYGGAIGVPGPYRMHELRLCDGLEPGTTYSYRVGGDGAWSDVYSFTTPPAPGAFDTFRLAMVGDSRGAYETWGQILAAMDAEDPDLILFSGDIIDLGVLQDEWDAWFEASGDVLARRVLVPAHGNHEFFAPHYFAQFSLPGNEAWFSHRYGDLELVVLNDTVLDRADIEVQQVAYLDAVFGGSDAPWRVVMHHRTAYGTSTVHGSAEDLQEAWVPRFEAHDVDLVLAGHNHAYERSVPIRAGAEVAPGEGPVYITAGGAGADLYENFAPDWFGAVAVATEHYLVADFGPTEVTATVRDLAGNTIDSFVLPR